MHIAPSHRNLDEPTSPPFYAGRKLRQVDQALIWAILHDDPQCPTRVLLDIIAQTNLPIAVSLRQVNRWRVKCQLSRSRGRPRGSRSLLGRTSDAVVDMTPQLALVGVHVF